MNENPFAVASVEQPLTEALKSRESQAVQAAMVIAQRFPRNELQQEQRILRGCQRFALADKAVYRYPRGDTTVRGPTIRLARHIARNWKNFESGWLVLDRQETQSTVMAYAWDLETNVREVRVFSVRHWRDTKQGGYAVEDERDIYEVCANQAARRERSCILHCIPEDIVETALEACANTVREAEKKNDSMPLADRVKRMAAEFDKLGVSVAMLEKKLGHPLSATTLDELVGELKETFTALRDGEVKRSELFDLNAGTTQNIAPDPEAPEPKKKKKAPQSPPPPPPVTPEPKPAPAPEPPPTAEQEDEEALRATYAKEEFLLNQVYVKMEAEDPPISEAEMLTLLKRRKECHANLEEMAQLKAATVENLNNNWEIYQAQIHIDRRGVKKSDGKLL